jgi:hypothetical protein
MLDDLDLIPDNLSIVEKSFVTLGKPWRFNDTFILETLCYYYQEVKD